jgi:hypothetical protein
VSKIALDASRFSGNEPRPRRPCLARLSRHLHFRRGDADVRLKLSAVFDAALLEGQYEDDLDYRLPLPAAVSRDTRNRIIQLLASAR